MGNLECQNGQNKQKLTCACGYNLSRHNYLQCMSKSPCKDQEDCRGSELSYAGTLGMAMDN